LVLSTVLGDAGVDFAEAAGLVAVLSRPRLPFGHLYVQVCPPLSDHSQDAFGSDFESYGSVESLLGLLAVPAPREAPVATELFERFFSGPPFLTRLGQVGGGPVLVLLERGECVEGRTGSLVDNPGQPEPFGPELLDHAAGYRSP
jgi:hypothetical protein